MFDDLRQTMEAIEFLDDPSAGSMRIGCSPLLAATFVCAVIERVCRRYPRIQFQLVSAPVETVHRDLHERKVDLLITRKVGPVTDERLSFESLFDDSLVIVAGTIRYGSLSRRRPRALLRVRDHGFCRSAHQSREERTLPDDLPCVCIEIFRQAVGYSGLAG
jgi:DNA-binding transcriptional LysR family regulator